MTPPAGLVRDLKARDPKLRLRYAPLAGEWWIEAPFAGAADPEIARTLADEYRGQLALAVSPATRHAFARRIEAVKAAQDGYRGIMFIPRDLIDHTDLILRTLHETDYATAGGPNGINRRLDAEGAAWDEARDKNRRAIVEEGARSTYDRLAWLEGRRMTTSDMTEGVETSDAVEQHEGFTVRMRKVLA